MVKILFNCSTNKTGGAIQTATNFIIQSLDEKEIEWHYALSAEIFSQLEKFDAVPVHHTIYNESPTHSKLAARQVIDQESEIQPALVFTMSGPAYVSFKSTHILGCSNPYITHAGLDAFFIRKSPVKIFITVMKILYQSWQVRKADYWMFQTNTSRVGFVKRLKVNSRNTFVVSNTCGKNYLENFTKNSMDTSEVKVLVPSAAFGHKNLELVPRVARYLKTKGYQAKFVLTLPDNSAELSRLMNLANELGVNDLLENSGPFSVKEGPALYADNDIIFLPSILETFSGVYVESMATRRPLVTTDKDFAKDICQDAALYFQKMNHTDAGDKIASLINSQSLYQKLISNGEQRIKSIPTIQQRYSQMREIILDIVGQK